MHQWGVLDTFDPYVLHQQVRPESMMDSGLTVFATHLGVGEGAVVDLGNGEPVANVAHRADEVLIF